MLPYERDTPAGRIRRLLASSHPRILLQVSLVAANLAFDECNCVANRDEPLRVAVVNSDAEFLFKRYDDLIEADAVSPKVQ
jgi:hypothetical protein